MPPETSIAVVSGMNSCAKYISGYAPVNVPRTSSSIQRSKPLDVERVGDEADDQARTRSRSSARASAARPAGRSARCRARPARSAGRTSAACSPRCRSSCPTRCDRLVGCSDSSSIRTSDPCAGSAMRKRSRILPGGVCSTYSPLPTAVYVTFERRGRRAGRRGRARRAGRRASSTRVARLAVDRDRQVRQRDDLRRQRQHAPRARSRVGAAQPRRPAVGRRAVSRPSSPRTSPRRSTPARPCRPTAAA